MQGTMMALGDYRFSVNTAAYQSLKRQHAYRWQAQPRLQQKPLQQFIGLGEETLTLSGVIYPHFAGGLHQLDNMRAQAKRGKPLLLVDGLGFVWGLWVIQSISEEQTLLLANGQPCKQSFELSLVNYG